MKAGADVKKLEKSVLYSEELGITFRGARDGELFKWFLASMLFGARISETIAKNAYRAFEKYRLLDPRDILRAGWDFLVYPVMREGGYVRYDEKTSRQLLKVCSDLIDRYGGSLNRLHKEAADSRDLEKRLDAFYGVGPVTVNIFLRELRPHWPKADPEPLQVVKKLARTYGIDLSRYDRKTVAFTRLEAGLIRLRKKG